jgi:Zn-dependent protease with chaperone function
MHYDYIVTLKRENARKTDLVSFIVLTFSILAFSYQQFRNGFSVYWSMAVSVLLLGLFLNIRNLRKTNDIQFRTWLFIAGLFWIGMPFLQWMIIPFFILGFLEVQAKRPLEIAFYSDGLVINSFFKKKIPWKALQSVVLKDDLLTLDFRNNKLFQKEILDDGDSNASDDEFNDYCHSKLINLH